MHERQKNCRQHEDRVAGAAGEQDALGAHHAGHHHRRGGGDRDGGGGRRRARQRIKDQIASIGSNLIIVLSGSVTSSGIRMGTGNAQTLTEDDARAIVRECDAAALAAPTVRGGVQVVYGNNNWGTQILGTTPDYLTIRDVADRTGPALHHQRRGGRGQSRAARQDRGRQPVQRRKSGRDRSFASRRSRSR